MNKQLRIDLPPNWHEATADMDIDAPTFIRENSRESGALQLSTAWYKTGPVPNPSSADLINFARNLALQRMHVHDVEDSRAGQCAVGKFGTVVAQRRGERVQVWDLSNGCDFVIATHTCIGVPDRQELDEAERIISAVRIKTSAAIESWWKFWK